VLPERFAYQQSSIFISHNLRNWIMRIISAIHIIAERRIEEAIREGKFQVEVWRNKPLPLDNDKFIPEDLKMAY